MHLGNYLFRKRKRAEIQQKDLSKRLNVSAQFVGRIERGEVGVPPNHLRKWCKFIDADIEKAKKLMVKDYKEKLEQQV